jgi:23S rRNA (guanosine2251-2'-O)-methyltransferase
MQQSKNAKELRDMSVEEAEMIKQGIERSNIYIVLESVYDTYNIGGIFRLADALAVKGVYLCGETTVPPNHRIAKASNGTYKIVDWAYKETVKEALEEIKLVVSRESIVDSESDKHIQDSENKVQVVAVEQDITSKPFTDITYSGTVILIAGNETFGVQKETLELCDDIAEIPMWGVNKSLNVILSTGIVAYDAVRKLKHI